MARNQVGDGCRTIYATLACWKRWGRLRPVKLRRVPRCDRIFDEKALKYLRKDIKAEPRLYYDERMRRAYLEHLRPRHRALTMPSPSALGRALRVRLFATFARDMNSLLNSRMRRLLHFIVRL